MKKDGSRFIVYASAMLGVSCGDTMDGEPQRIQHPIIFNNLNVEQARSSMQRAASLGLVEKHRVAHAGRRSLAFDATELPSSDGITQHELKLAIPELKHLIEECAQPRPGAKTVTSLLGLLEVGQQISMDVGQEAGPELLEYPVHTPKLIVARHFGRQTAILPVFSSASGTLPSLR